jgi:hypothetical protein
MKMVVIGGGGLTGKKLVTRPKISEKADSKRVGGI